MTTPPMIDALDAPRHEVNGRAGRLAYYAQGDGPPLLLLHSMNASGSAYEIKPIFEHYRATRRVYAPDLPGFGWSDRSPRDYNIALYVDAIFDMLDEIERDTGQSHCDALALSLTSEFLARAAVKRAQAFSTLALITPTGFRKGSQKMRAPEGTTREFPGLHRILTVPLWRRGLFNLLTRPGTIRYFLERSWGSKNIDEGLAAYDVIISAQPDAEHAPYAFLSARLFSKDIRNVYEQIEQPVWLGHGTRGDFKDFSEAGWTETRGNWTKRAFEAGALPHFECPALFFSELSAFLDAPV